MKKYSSNKNIWWFFFVFGILVFLILVIPPDNLDTVIGALIFLVLVWIIGFIIVNFTYATLNDGRLFYTNQLIFRQKVDVIKIISISYLPTWKIQQEKICSFFIHYEQGLLGKMEFKNSVFSEKTLGELAHDLKHANPHITLDAKATKLMREYEQSLMKEKS